MYIRGDWWEQIVAVIFWSIGDKTEQKERKKVKASIYFCIKVSALDDAMILIGG